MVIAVGCPLGYALVMRRLYEHIIKDHFASETKMVLLAGPRQVGKTTTSRESLPGALYLNWDNDDHRALILRGPQAVFQAAGGATLRAVRPAIIFDELHKYRRWKTFIKGFYDTYGRQLRVCITGSARLDIYRQGGDSLMGRYFLYRMHPLSVREVVAPRVPHRDIQLPHPIPAATFERLLAFGGYPEPYVRAERRFYTRWKTLRLDALFTQDLRDISDVADIARMKTTALRLAEIAAGQLSYSHLANDVQVSVDTIRRWLTLLESLFYCFRVRPYTKNVARTLLKEPKIFLWDWSLVSDPGARRENFVAAHLLKAVHLYTDLGLGTFDLFYVRDKSKREVDFLVERDGIPWFCVEVKSSPQPLSPALHYFQHALKVPHAFQVTFDAPYVEADCFARHDPVVVPATTFLSQLA
jgi:uncharacterized protein